MGIFSKKEVVKEPDVAKVGMKGRELHVNPSRDMTLARLEGRVRNIKKALEINKYSDEKRAALDKSLKRYEFEIMLRKGEM